MTTTVHTGTPADRITGAVNAAICESFGCSRDEVTPRARLGRDLGMDSMDIIELVMELEERFEIDITDEEADGWVTVQDLHDFFVAKVPA